MARLKLQSSWEESKKHRGLEKGFLGDLVRAARHADRAMDEMDLYESFHETSTSTTPGTGLHSTSKSEPGSPQKSGLDRPSSTGENNRSRKAAIPSFTLRPVSAPHASGKPVGGASPRSGQRSSPVSARVPSSASSALRTAAGILSTPRQHGAISRTGLMSKLVDTLATSGEINRACSPAVSRNPLPSANSRKHVPDVPDWFRSDGVPAPLHSQFLPEYDLWVTLHGGNGTWKQHEAKAEWEKQVQEYEVSKREWALREERERARLIEAERRRKAEQEEDERRAAEAEAERRRKREEEERRVHEAEMRRREKLAEQERDRQRKLPRTCTACDGSGHCNGCTGRGFTQTLYLSTSVRASSAVTGAHLAGGLSSGAALVTNIATNSAGPSGCGRLPRGCETCGGWGDGADWGEFISGSGRCITCQGLGKIQAPKGGWPI